MWITLFFVITIRYPMIWWSKALVIQSSGSHSEVQLGRQFAAFASLQPKWNIWTKMWINVNASCNFIENIVVENKVSALIISHIFWNFYISLHALHATEFKTLDASILDNCVNFVISVCIESPMSRNTFQLFGFFRPSFITTRWLINSEARRWFANLISGQDVCFIGHLPQKKIIVSSSNNYFINLAVLNMSLRLLFHSAIREICYHELIWEMRRWYSRSKQAIHAESLPRDSNEIYMTESSIFILYYL